MSCRRLFCFVLIMSFSCCLCFAQEGSHIIENPPLPLQGFRPEDAGAEPMELPALQGADRADQAPAAVVPEERARPRPIERVQTAEEIPLLAVLEVESNTLDPGAISFFTQMVWNEVRKTRQVRLMRLRASQHILSVNGLGLNTPYQPPSSRRQIAQALGADYLILGNVNTHNNYYLAELMLYEAATNSILDSERVESNRGFDHLMSQLQAPVEELMLLVPYKALTPEAFHAAMGTQPREGGEATDLVSQIEYLKQRNARLERQLQALQRQLLSDSQRGVQAPPRVAASSDESRTLPRLAPVQHGNKKAVPLKIAVAGGSAAEPEESWEPLEERVEPEEPDAPIAEELPMVTQAEEPRMEMETEEPEVLEATAPPTEAERAQARSLYEKSRMFPTDSPEGIPLLEQALELDPSNAVYQKALIVRLYECERYQECTRRGMSFVDRGSTDVTLNIYIGAAYAKLDEYQHALEAADRVLQLEPHNKFGLYNRALNLYQLGRPEAAEAFETFLEKAEGDAAMQAYREQAKTMLQQIREAQAESSV